MATLLYAIGSPHTKDLKVKLKMLLSHVPFKTYTMPKSGAWRQSTGHIYEDSKDTQGFAIKTKIQKQTKKLKILEPGFIKSQANLKCVIELVPGMGQLWWTARAWNTGRPHVQLGGFALHSNVAFIRKRLCFLIEMLPPGFLTNKPLAYGSFCIWGPIFKT